MNIRQHPIVFAIGDNTAAIGALFRRGDFCRGAAVGTVGDGGAFLAWVGLESCLTVEDHLVFHIPVAVGVALEHLLGLVVDDVVAHQRIEPHGEHFFVAILTELM